MITSLDDGVSRVCDAYLELADRHVPGLVGGLYLQGSIALGDYRPGKSDIDFVAVVDERPDAELLRRVHAELRKRHARPFFDGLYVTREDLRRDPEKTPAGPSVHRWRFTEESRAERHLVTWHVLARGGVAVRGPSVAELGVHLDPDALAHRTRENMATYWTRWVANSSRPLSSWGIASFSDHQTSWGALGVTRLRQTLATGEIASKTAAGEYALETFDERWHRIVREALRIRTGGPSLHRNRFRRRADLLAYMTMVLEK
ncbi:aminoglycoside adenylyltransferase domain-containing protein [Streptosporangium sp. NPDC051022]|uniref:nucleotidyltransferase domain-containing protein n=1 Tax=Streptosporangium sp. NPDC051022 TaxID=3155752 RepID=UPI003442D0AC